MKRYSLLDITCIIFIVANILGYTSVPWWLLILYVVLTSCVRITFNKEDKKKM